MGSESSNLCPFKNKVKEDLTDRTGNVTTVTETGVTHAVTHQECEHSAETGTRKEWILPWGLQREYGPKDALLSDS